MPERGTFGQYLYGRNFLALSPRADALGESLAILFDLADPEKSRRITEEMPLIPFGVPTVYPQTPGIPPYHNDSVWPFVAAYWTWAAAEARNAAAVEHGLASIYRAAAIFLTNKENMVGTTGDFEGTEINSSRQLWSVAGNLATVYRVLFGMRFEPDRLVLEPFVPRSYAGTLRIEDFPYREARLTLVVRGYGSRIASVSLDGRAVEEAVVHAGLTGGHTLEVVLAEDDPGGRVHLVENVVAPETPAVWDRVEGGVHYEVWDRVEGGVHYEVWDRVEVAVYYEVSENRRPYGATIQPEFRLGLDHPGRLREYQVRAVDSTSTESFWSEPLRVPGVEIRVDLAEPLSLEKTDTARFEVDVRASGVYAVDFFYANGHGPVNTDNKAAIRTLLVDGDPAGPVVMPQRGSWEDRGYSSHVWVPLTAGQHIVELVFLPENENMNGEVNHALVEHLRMALVEPTR